MEARLAVEQATVAEPTDNRELSVLAVIDAGLGRKEVAIREAKRACDLAPWDDNAIDAPIVRCNPRGRVCLDGRDRSRSC